MTVSERQIVVGIDSGGSTTRVACIDRDGELVGEAVGGAGNPEHSSTSAIDVRATVAKALAHAGRSPGDVVALVAGMAGLNVDGDLRWATGHTYIDGLTDNRVHVNDTVVAHAGALLGSPGVLVVGGTGSMILGVDRQGRHYRNDHWQHYAGGARHLAYDVVHRLLIGEGAHDEICGAAFRHWKVTSIESLRDATTSLSESEAVKRAFGSFAPEVTAHAESSSLAHDALSRLAALTVVGMRLVGDPLGERPVIWSSAGSLATHGSFITPVENLLASASASYEYRPPAMNPLGGAALLAIRRANWETPDTIARLQAAFR